MVTNQMLSEAFLSSDLESGGGGLNSGYCHSLQVMGSEAQTEKSLKN